jgi:hypothetical protein
MDQDIFALVGKYGFKALHSRLNEIMRAEFEYLKSQFDAAPTAAPQPQQPQQPQQSQQPQQPQQTQLPVKTIKKIRKPYTKKSKNTAVEEPIVSEKPEIKDVIVVAPVERQGFRDPKEVKAFQKAAEEAKHKENVAAGIDVSKILTKDNLKQWIEQEGHTYAWVAREKAGCPDTQVAATAQMMGVKSKISKRRGMVMGSH